MNSEYKIGIVVVAYHNPAMTIRYITKELVKLTSAYTLVIVNNASTLKDSQNLAQNCEAMLLSDYTEGVIPEASKYLIWTSENLGYAKGNNKGVDFLKRVGSFTHYLFSNDDIEIKSNDVLAYLCKSMSQQKDVGIIGPRIIGLDGREQSPHDTYISPLRQIGWKLFSFLRHRNKNKEQSQKKLLSAHCTYWISGAFMLVDANAFNQVGGFDSRTFLYYEEVILSEKMSKIGQYAFFDPNCIVLHYEGGSTEFTRSKKNRQISKKSSLVYYKNYRQENQFILWLYSIIC